MTDSKYDLTIGKPLNKIIGFAFPILLGNIFQQLYNVVDIAIISYTIGSESLAAIGSTSVIFGLLISISQGMTNSFSILIARHSNNSEKFKKTLVTLIILYVILSLSMTLFSIFGVKQLVQMLNVPKNILCEAQTYIGIISNFIAITFFYNAMSGLLRGLGNSKVSLIALIISSLVHIFLDYIFVVYLNTGVSGIAYSTVISQLLSALICLFYFLKKYQFLELSFNKHFDKNILCETFYLGLSIALTLSIVSISSIVFQKAINNFGTDIIASYAASGKIKDVLMLPLITLSIAMSTYVSQNFGVKKYERIFDGIKISFIFSAIWIILINIFVLFTSKQLIVLITNSSNLNIIDFARNYLSINLPFFIILSIVLILRSSLQGVGRKAISIFSGITELILKVLFVSYFEIKYWQIYFCDPIIWSLCGIIITYDFFRWKNIQNQRSFDLC